MFASMMANFDKYDVYFIVLTAATVIMFMKLKGSKAWNFDHFWQNLDKFLLVFMFVLAFGILMHAYHHNVDSGGISWMQNTAGQILSALLAVLGGRAFVNRAGNSTNGNGYSSSSTTTSTVATSAASSTPAPVVASTPAIAAAAADPAPPTGV